MKEHTRMRLLAIDRGGVPIKKIIIAMVCIMLMLIAGCDRAADDENSTGNHIIGNWSISYAKNAVTGEYIPLQHLYGTGIAHGGTLTFHKDNTFERHVGITGDDDATKGTYGVHGDVITLKYDNGAENTAIYLSLSQEIEYRLETPKQSPVYEYYVKAPSVYWRGWPYAFRENRLDTYLRKEIEDNDFIQSSEGSLVAGYYENEELRIIKITVYQSRHQVILRFYPFNGAIVLIEEVIRYATDKPLHEVTDDDMRLDKVEQAVIKDGQLYYYIDEREPMYLSDNAWYAEIYTQALEALDDAG